MARVRGGWPDKAAGQRAKQLLGCARNGQADARINWKRVVIGLSQWIATIAPSQQ